MTDTEFIGPGDGGPCPICGEDMAEKEYPAELITGEKKTARGRYWHMANEHHVLENYVLEPARRVEALHR